MTRATSRRLRPAVAIGVAAAFVVSLVVGVPGSPAGANGGGPSVPFPASPEDVRVVGRVVPDGPEFDDVPARASYGVATAWLADQNITQGYGGPGNFSPDRPVTRRQMALYLWRLARTPEAAEDCSFADVTIDPTDDSDVEFEGALCWLAETGVTTGVGTTPGGDPLYGPSESVTRSQMARFLWRLSGEREATTLPEFTDVSATGEVRDAVNWLAEFGITTGTSPTTFTPRGVVTRGQMAAFLYRLAVNGDAWASGVRVTGSVEQISVVGAPGTEVSLYDGSAMFLENATLDVDGGWLWRSLDPGIFTVTVADGRGGSIGFEVVVTGADDGPPPSSLYTGQTLREGYNYLTTRDGTQLAAMVAFPSTPGPWPTVVEYSGYDLADPYTAIGAGSSPYRFLAPQFGYAIVQVQMRGSGCSGGAFDYFEPLQNLDGYDAIETVAAQSWVKPNAVTGEKVVGMVGISYPGISQLFVASAAPPSLAAITPVSVVPDMARGVLRPGGILNDGFAVGWAEGAVSRGRPARQTGNPEVNGGWTGGVPYVARRISEGDPTCRLNQRLHGQQADLIGRIEAATYELPTDEYLSPMRFVGNIEAATLMVGAWQDEQTGGMWPILATEFSDDTYLRLIAQNGTHIEPIMPDNLKAAFEHLAMFVKGERPNFNVPLLNTLIGAAAGLLVGSGPIPPGGELVFTGSGYDNSSTYPTFADAYADYLNLPRLTVRLENGAGPTDQAGGSLVPAENRFFSGFPLREGEVSDNEVTERTWYLRGDGALVDDVGALVSDADDIVTYAYDPDEGARTIWTGAAGCSEWEPTPTDDLGNSCYDWAQPGPGESAAFLTAALDADTLMVGGGLVEVNAVWLPDSGPAADLTGDVEVTLTEVTPDGKEVYVQTGWARTSYCEVDPTYSLPRLPWASATPESGTNCALSSGEERRVQVPIFPFAHMFREGSKIRLSIDSPGNSRVRWAFVSDPDPAEIELHLDDQGGRAPSVLQLPVVTSELYQSSRNPTTGLRTWSQRGSVSPPRLPDPPTCGVLRAQPCRTFEAAPPP